MNCEFCQSPAHIWFQCPRKPDGWKPARLANKSRLVISDQYVGVNTEPSTAARKDVLALDPQVPEDHASTVGRVRAGRRKGHEQGDSPVGEMSGTRRASRHRDAESSAGTQALPVETNKGEAQKAERRSPKPEAAGSIPATFAKFDRQAWMREYMRTYMRDRRAKLKASKVE